MPAYAAIYRVVSRIKRGQVMTYGEVAEKAGTIARVVGNAMRHARDTGLNVRWWRVLKKVNDRYARISPKAAKNTQKEQRKLLKEDRVDFINGRVDRHKYRAR